MIETGIKLIENINYIIGSDDNGLYKISAMLIDELLHSGKKVVIIDVSGYKILCNQNHENCITLQGYSEPEDILMLCNRYENKVDYIFMNLIPYAIGGILDAVKNVNIPLVMIGNFIEHNLLIDDIKHQLFRTGYSALASAYYINEDYLCTFYEMRNHISINPQRYKIIKRESDIDKLIS